MIRTILVALDGTHAPTELAIDWAKRLGAGLTGIAIVDDEPNRRPGPYLSYSSHNVLGDFERLAEVKKAAKRYRDDFQTQCKEAGVHFSTRIEVGDPVETLLTLHELFDVTLVPQQPLFRFGITERPDDTVTELLRESRCPIVVVPETHAPSNRVLVAYDGSPAAADALKSFAESGLGVDRAVTVISADRDLEAAKRRASEAAKFLEYHDVHPTVRPLSGGADDADAIAAATEFADAGMVVMGAFSRGRVREWFRPSVTARMLSLPGRLAYLQHHPK